MDQRSFVGADGVAVVGSDVTELQGKRHLEHAPMAIEASERLRQPAGNQRGREGQIDITKQVGVSPAANFTPQLWTHPDRVGTVALDGKGEAYPAAAALMQR